MIYVLKDGRIVQRGTHAELATDKAGEYFQLFEAQMDAS